MAAGNFGDTVLNSAELYNPGIAITLSAVGRKVGEINTVRLTWSGANSTNIDVNRNGVVIAADYKHGHLYSFHRDHRPGQVHV